MSDAAVKGVIFDFEGTLVDFQWRLVEGEEALRRAFGALGVPHGQLVDLSYSSMWNRTVCDRELRREGQAVDEDELRRLVGPVYDHYDMDALSRWRARPGAAATLRALRAAGVNAALVSNIGRAALFPALVRFELDAYLQPVLSRDDVCLMKPDPEGILRVLEQWRLAPAEVLFVGDSRTDVRAARAARVRVAVVAGGESSPDALAAEPPDYTIDGLSEVLGLAVPRGGDA